MKKTIVMGLFVLSLSLTGCFNKDEASAPVAPEAPAVTPEEPVAEDLSNLSLSEWFARGEATKCTVSSPTGVVDAWVLGNKVRIEGIGFDPKQPEQIGHMISDGEWVYTWSGTTGIKFNANEMANQATGGATSSETSDWKETIATWENGGAEYNCEKSEVTDALFVAPEGIVFNDLSALLDVASSTTESLMNNIPGNTEDVEAALEAAGVNPVPGAAVDEPIDPRTREAVTE